MGNPGSIPGSGRSSGEGNGNLLQYPCLENPMDGEPGRLQSMGSQRVGHNCATSLSFFLSHSYMTTGKTTALTRWNFVSKITSLLFNIKKSHSFSAKEQASFNFTAAVTICSDFVVQENKVSHHFHCFPMYICLLQPHHTPLWLLSLSLDLISFTTSPCVCVCMYVCIKFLYLSSVCH